MMIQTLVNNGEREVKRIMERNILDLLIIIGNLICVAQPDNPIRGLNYLTIILLGIVVLVRLIRIAT